MEICKSNANVNGDELRRPEKAQDRTGHANGSVVANFVGKEAAANESDRQGGGKGNVPTKVQAGVFRTWLAELGLG